MVSRRSKKGEKTSEVLERYGLFVGKCSQVQGSTFRVKNTDKIEE